MISNFSYLSLLEILGLLFPLITYPYLIRILGKEIYGAVIMAQSIIAYLIIIVNFGFNVSATKDISKKRYDKNSLSNIVSAVFILKTFIFILVSIIYLLIINFIDINNKILYIYSLGLCFQEIFFPTWFFQGQEKMKFITLISFIIRVIFLILIFIIIKSEQDFIYVPLINSFGGVIASILSIYILVKYFSIKFVLVPFAYIKIIFLRSIPFFFSRFISVAMEKTNAVLVGSVLSFADLAVYDLVTKIVGLLKIPFNLLAQVLYPSIAISKDRNMIVKFLKIVIYLSLAIVFVMFFLTPIAVKILGGEELLSAINLVYIFDMVLPGYGISVVLGASTLVTFGYIKEYNYSVIYTFVLYLIIVGAILLFNNFSLYTIAIAYILPEYGVCVYRYYITKKYILIKR